MRANSMCISCILSKQEQMIRGFQDEERKAAYLHEVLDILYRYGQNKSAPWMTQKIDEVYLSFWGSAIDYSSIKHKYNQLLLEREGEIETIIRQSDDPIRSCINYVCAGNYIDYSAVEDVNENMLQFLIDKASNETIPENVFDEFNSDLKRANNLIYLTDNCGEIVMDKIFIKLIQESFPSINITVILRGTNVLNDATMEDAKEVGLDEVARCIGNGTGIPGTDIDEISDEARKLLREADMIIAKGQGNFESLFGNGLNPYYLFLCKCELFVKRFGLKQFSSVLVKEEKLKNKGISIE